MNTRKRLVVAAADLLDQGGNAALTLRAVAAASGVSHNAPYKHFSTRDDLLAAVAAADLTALADDWREVRETGLDPLGRLLAAIDVVIRLSQEHPARYRLLFASPHIAARGGDVTAAADRALRRFADLVEDCQEAGHLPAAPSNNLAIVLFAATHGLIDADAHGRLRSESGWAEIRTGVRFLVDLLHRR